MEFTRRSAIAMGAGAFAALSLPKLAVAAAGDDAIAAFTGGAEMADTGVTLTAPEIAENGNTVPIEVDARRAFDLVNARLEGAPDAREQVAVVGRHRSARARAHHERGGTLVKLVISLSILVLELRRFDSVSSWARICPI